MKADKLTDDLNFTVRYADGAVKYVEEGVLFEFDLEKITLHLGTERKEALFSIAEALTEAIVEMGLGEEFRSYVGQEDDWIPVSERLPEDGTYLCTFDGELCGLDEPFTGMCGIEGGRWDEDGCVMAWQPLPEPYRPPAT